MTKRKGNAPGQGRQPTIAPRGQVDRIEARVSSAQKAEYIKRGGSQALRDWLNGKPAEIDNSNTVAHNASSNNEQGETQMEFGVVYKPSCAWRECNTEAEARDCFEHAPQPDGETAVLIINGDEVESRQPDE